MAIAKMKKLMFIAPNRIQSQLMDAVQELQSLEFISLSQGQSMLEESKPSNQKNLQELESKVDRLQEDICLLEKYLKQPSLMKKLKTKKETFTIEELQQTVSNWDYQELMESVENYRVQLQKFEDKNAELVETETLLRKWGNLDFHPKEIFKQPFTKTKMGTIPQTTDNRYLESLKESQWIVVQEVYHTREEVGVFATYSRKHQQEAKEELAKVNFSVTWYPFDHSPKEELQLNLERQKQLKEAKNSLVQEMQQQEDLVRKLKLYCEYAFNEWQKEIAKEQLYSGEHLFCLHGYLCDDVVEQAKQQIEEYGIASQVTVVELEINPEEYEEAPTVLKNHSLIKPFEMMIEMYGLPKYGEVDPTPFTAPFYLVFFGMMSADIGYGLVLWLATFLALKLFVLDKGMKRNLMFFHLLSYPTVAWGIIFGSFFGVDMPFQPLSLSKDLTTIMILSIIFGVIQIIVGLFIGAYSNWKKKDYANAYTTHIGWLAIIFGLILYLVGSMILNIPILATIGSYVAIIAAVLIVIVSMLTSSNKFAGLASGLYNLYGISGYVGDVVSYTRLMALAVSGGSIAAAFNMLVTFLPPVARVTVGILLLIALHGLNIFLTFLGAYVHGLRLQFVEFFGKFYEGGGRALKPFKTYEKYIETKQKSNQ